MIWFFFCNDTATTEIYTLSLHDALPIFLAHALAHPVGADGDDEDDAREARDEEDEAQEADEDAERFVHGPTLPRSEEHTSELQSRQYLVCRLLLEKKKTGDLERRALLER